MEQTKKPKVFRCESNGVVAIVAEIDYREWWMFTHARAVIAGSGEPNERRARPHLTMFFTDNARRRDMLGSLITGSRNDCEKLIRECEVEDAYLFIPGISDPSHGFIPITLSAAHALIKDKFIPGAVPSQ